MKAHTLHIGINYTGTMSQLYGCHNDALDMYALCAPKAATATKLIGSKADREGIVKAFRRVRERLQEPGDIMFVTLSSHGTNEEGQQGIVAADMEVIWDYEVDDDIVDRLKQTYMIFLLDCCHAYGMGSKAALPVRKFITNRHPRIRSIPIELCRTHPRLKANPSRTKANCGYLAGCETESYSYDGWFDNRANGACTYYTLQAAKKLKGTQPHFYDLFQLVGGKRPRGFLPSEDYPQQPMRYGSKANWARRIPFL